MSHPQTPKRDGKRHLQLDANGRVEWQVHPPFSQGLLDRARQLVPRDLTDKERQTILKEN